MRLDNEKSEIKKKIAEMKLKVKQQGLGDFLILIIIVTIDYK